MHGDKRLSTLTRGAGLLTLVLAGGTIGFMVLERYTLLDALYMTVITISTVGFGEVRPLDRSGHLFVILLIITGLAVVGYTLTSLGQAIVEGSVQRMFWRRRMMREIESMRDHYIVCGHGRMGRVVCRELKEEKVPFLVIERDADAAALLHDRGYRVVQGDATEDEVLARARVDHARALVSVVSRDVDNLYITLSAREMCRQDNAGLYILARASDARDRRKLQHAGANRVISADEIGAMRIVQALLRPTVFDFMEVTTTSSHLELMFEEMTVGPANHLAGSKLRDSSIRQNYDVIIIAAKKADGTMVFNPGSEYMLEAGDVLITLGNKDQLGRLRRALA